MGERTQANANTRDDWLRRRALKVPSPRYLHVSAPLRIINEAGLKRVVVAPKSERRTFVAGRNAAKRARRAQTWAAP